MGSEFSGFNAAMQHLGEQAGAGRNDVADIARLLEVSIDLGSVDCVAAKERAPYEQVAHVFEVLTLAAEFTQSGDLGWNLIPVTRRTSVGVLGHAADEGPVRYLVSSSFPGIGKSSGETQNLRPLAHVDRGRCEPDDLVEYS